MQDEWGNPVDSRTGNHLVSLRVTSTLTPDDCAFNNTNVFTHDITLPLDADGNRTVSVRLTSKIGTNYIQMAPIGKITSPPLASIKVIANGIPFSMTGTIWNKGVLPTYDEVPANNIDTFRIDYRVYDGYGNPMAQEPINITTNITGELEYITKTDDYGLVRIEYGPKDTLVTAGIMAFALDNATKVKNVTHAHFVADMPAELILSVTPQNMLSNETAPPGEVAFVRATVVDHLGNPVAGEPVDFEMDDAVGDPVVIQPAFMSPTHNVTSVYGDAIVYFKPGTFPRSGEPNYKPRATASTVITVTWKGMSKKVTATWRNYPFLNIQASVNKSSNLLVGDPIDVTIDVIGNGFYTDSGGKIAAMLDIDSTTNIWSNKDGTLPPGYPCLNPNEYPKNCVREDSAKAAANAFAEEMLLPELSGNFIGVEQFGELRKGDFRLLEPQERLYLVQSKIANLIPGTNSNNFAASIETSITNLSESQVRRPDDLIRAVIILKDSGSNIDNKPPSKEELIAYARSTTPPTLIFTVYYYDGKSEDSYTQRMLQDLAAGTGGKFYRAENATALIQAFKDIATYLKYAAGVNTQLNLNFQTLEVNGNATSNLHSEVFKYVPVAPFYPLDTHPWPRDAVTSRTRIMWPNTTNSAVDQSAEWDATHQLRFNIGVVNITERWNTTYTLKVNQSGFINLFNCSMSASNITFQEPYGAFNRQMLCLDDLYVKVNLISPSPLGELVVKDLTPQSGSYTSSVPLTWNLKYKGSNTVTETYWYSYRGLPYVQFGSEDDIPPTYGSFVPRSTQLNIADFPPGDYKIKVHAHAPGYEAEDTGGFTKPYGAEAINIELK